MLQGKFKYFDVFAPVSAGIIPGFLKESGVEPESLTAVAARGSGFGPMESGAYVINEALEKAGAPKNLVCTVSEPSIENTQAMLENPKIHLLVATGGPAIVNKVLSSGKKAIGAGAGNPPVIVDDTADIAKAAKDIIDGCTFDNNLPCIAEKEVFVFDNVADELIKGMLKAGSYMLTREQADKLADIILDKKEKDGKIIKSVNRNCVGRDAKVLLAKIGVNVSDDIRCAIAEVPFEHDFVQNELMMPILGIVRVKNIDEAIDLACKAEAGRRHSAHMHSKNIDNLSRFAKAIETTIFVKNGDNLRDILNQIKNVKSVYEITRVIH